MSDSDAVHPSRRVLFAGAGVAGLAGLLAACGEGGTPGEGGVTASPRTPAGGAPQGEVVLAKKSEVPVGGGKIIPEEAVVVAQPTAGTFVGLSAICTHQQCIVAKIEKDRIKCGCHGSEYSLFDGSVKRGPARRALERVPLKIDGEDITFG